METLFEKRYTVNLRMLRSFSRGASFSQKFFSAFPWSEWRSARWR